MKIRAMADEKHSVFVRTLLLIGIMVLVGALEEMDEDLYLFLSSQLAPPPTCPEHEVYQACSGNCSDCARRGSCRADCSFKGCDCLHNFARIEPGGPCQSVHLCPVSECGENEVFRECGAVCERCQGVRCRMLQCEHRCYCAEGHLRDDAGKCVPEDQCPKKERCFRDEEMGPSGRVDEYCLRDEATSNATETRDRCYCREGFSRNAVGHCVRDELCENVQCSGVEVYQSCPRKCNVTCRGEEDGDCEEDGQCFPGCFCPDGHRVDDFRRCVPEHHCPTGSTSTPASFTQTPDSSPPLTSTTEERSTEVHVSSSSPTTETPDEEEILPELPEEEFVVVESTTTRTTLPTTTTLNTTTTLPTTATADTDDPTSISTQDRIETSPTPAKTASEHEEKNTTTAAPQTTVQETDTTRAEDDEATTLETTTPGERSTDHVVTTTTTPPEEEENDF